MAEYISSYTTGFETIVKQEINRFLKEIKVIAIYDGLIYYSYDGNIKDLNKLFYLNNTFIVYKFFYQSQLNFKNMVKSTLKSNIKYINLNKRSFRIRFSHENQFAKVDNSLLKLIENDIFRNTNMTINRTLPDTEFWYIIRRENVGFYCQLIRKRKFMEKNLNKGELRPELAYLLCCCCKIEANHVVIDPFAGFGAIPIQITKHFHFKKMIISDLSKERYNYLKGCENIKKPNITILNNDALNLKSINSKSIDIIITDPPWGIYEKNDNIQSFYENMIIEFERILCDHGTIVLLTAKKDEFESALHVRSFFVQNRLNTLVNGKKASVYIIKKRQSIEQCH